MQRPLPLGPVRRLFSCSPTKLATWVSCPRRFRFTYLDRPTPPRGGAWAHLSYGSSAHLALRAWWDLPIEDRSPEAAGHLVRDVWVSDGFRDNEQSSQWCELAAQQVSSYAERIDPAREPRGLERLVAMKTPRLTFSGRVDRIDEVPFDSASEGTDDERVELVIIDYKTGRQPPSHTDARASAALALYAEAAQRLFHRRCRIVELHHLPSGTVARWEHDDASVNRHIERADQIGAEAGVATSRFHDGEADVAAEFPARPSAQCGWCDFRSVCPEGEQASVKRQPWDGLASG